VPILRSRARRRHRRPKQLGPVAAALVMLTTGAGAVLAPSAASGHAVKAEQAVATARGSTSCAPLQYNSTVEHAADIINQSTLKYLNHTAKDVPVDNPNTAAIMKDLGVETAKVIPLQGAAYSESDAIKGVLLEGREAIPDCSYTDFGVSRLYEPESRYTLVVVVLMSMPR
jgi:hypothetical protein